MYEIINNRKESLMETIEISRTVKSRIVFLNHNDIPKIVASQKRFDKVVILYLSIFFITVSL